LKRLSNLRFTGVFSHFAVADSLGAEEVEYTEKQMELFGEAIYNGRPCGVNGIGKNFALKSVDGKAIYFFIYDLSIKGDENVTLAGKYKGAYAFGGITDEIDSVCWMDDGEELDFVQGKGMISVNFTGFPYGKAYPVRVAKAIIK